MTDFTRGKSLYYSLCFALRPMTIETKRGRVKVRLTDAEKTQIAEAVIARLKLHGDIWKLEDPMPSQVGH